MANDLWGEIALEEEVNAPIEILRQQALLLGEKTNFRLGGTVISGTRDYGNELVHTLMCIVPSIEDYRYPIVAVRHYARSFYPITVVDIGEDERESICQDETEYVDELGKILSSKPVKDVLKTLLAQSS